MSLIDDRPWPKPIRTASVRSMLGWARLNEPEDHPQLVVLRSAGDDPARLAQALKESHELLALAEQSAGIGIWDTDLATDMVRATPTFFRIMGLPVSAEPVANDIVRAVRHPDDAARVREGFRDALARGLDSYEVEYRIIRPVDGELRWIFGRGRTVRDAPASRFATAASISTSPSASRPRSMSGC